MGKYDFIKLGNLLYWHDPDSGLSNGVYQVASIPENIEWLLTWTGRQILQNRVVSPLRKNKRCMGQ